MALILIDYGILRDLRLCKFKALTPNTLLALGAFVDLATVAAAKATAVAVLL